MMENNIITTEQAAAATKMTSIEIAQLTGKSHSHVMRDIRNMEPSWEKVHQTKFGQMQIREALPNGGYRMRPCYVLTKLESLYIATKYNDEARAKLILRWAELESGLRIAQQEPTERRMLETEQEILKRSDAIRQTLIGRENAHADGCLTTSEVARALDMTVKELNRLLVEKGVVYYNGGRYKLKAEYEGHDLAQDRAFHYYGLEGEKKERHYLVWTTEGAEFLKEMIG